VNYMKMHIIKKSKILSVYITEIEIIEIVIGKRSKMEKNQILILKKFSVN